MNPFKEKKDTFRITIQKVTKDYLEETETKYYDKKTGKELTWSEYYANGNAPDTHVSHQVGTGKIKVEERTEQVYQQDKETLDIAEVALYINRTR